MRGYELAYMAQNSVFLCVVCGSDGVVVVTVTRDPAASITRRTGVAAAQWAWVGSESRAKLLVRRLRKQWAQRSVHGRGYRFDYGCEGLVFREELNAAFLAVVGGKAEWEKLGHDAVRMLRAKGKPAAAKRA